MMTVNDELRKRIGDVLFFKSPAFTKGKPPRYRSDFDPIAEAVIVAVLKSGYVIGKEVEEEDLDEVEQCELRAIFSLQLVSDFGLALIRKERAFE